MVGHPSSAPRSPRLLPKLCARGPSSASHHYRGANITPFPPTSPSFFTRTPEAAASAASDGRFRRLLSGRICIGALAGAVQTRLGSCARSAPHRGQPGLPVGRYPPALTTQGPSARSLCPSSRSPPRHGRDNGLRCLGTPHHRSIPSQSRGGCRGVRGNERALSMLSNEHCVLRLPEGYLHSSN